MEMEITLFTTSTCPACNTAKELLKKNEIKFNTINIENGYDEMAEYQYFASKHILPLILVTIEDEYDDVYIPYTFEAFEGPKEIQKAIDFILEHIK